MRWLSPVLFFGAAVYLWRYNGTHDDRKLLFPGVEVLVGPDIQAQGEVTWMLFGGLGVLFTLVAVTRTTRDRRRRAEE